MEESGPSMDEDTASTSAAPGQSAGDPEGPICVIVVGMAGSGKSCLVQRMCSWLQSQKCPPYAINLDPAAMHIPFPANIDIRSTVNYGEVMKQYDLGPNGAILTSLNLFSTCFDKVMEFINARRKELKYVIFDTPGQIEVFTWSASGSIITEVLASTYPTVIVYVMDVVRSAQPTTFMSNMLYACSILYRNKLPFIVAINKTDVVRADFALEWMKDFQAFMGAIENDESYVSELTCSLALALEEFYVDLKCVGVSAFTGENMAELFDLIDKGKAEYKDVYLEDLKERQAKQEKSLAESQADRLAELKLDLVDNLPQEESRKQHVEERAYLRPYDVTGDNMEEDEEEA